MIRTAHGAAANWTRLDINSDQIAGSDLKQPEVGPKGAGLDARNQSMPKSLAFEVILELLLDIARQTTRLRFELLFECPMVFVNDLLKKRTLRAVAHMAPCSHAQTGFPASE